MAVESSTAKRTTWTITNWMKGLLAMMVVAGALSLLGMGLARTSSTFVVDVDGQRYTVNTHATTVGSALHHAGLSLYPEDLISPSPETPLQPGSVVQVRCAQPVVLHVDGQTYKVRTQARTVLDVLAEEGISLEPADEVWVNGQLAEPDAPLRGVFASRQVSNRGGTRNSVPLEGGATSLSGPSQDVPVISLHRAATLAIVDDGVTATLRTTLSTVGQLLEAEGITLFVGDQVTPGLQEQIVPGMMVGILRSVPISIEVDGQVIRTRTRAENVAGVLGQEAIALVGKDRSEPALDTSVKANMTIHITRVREEFEVELETIPFATEWVANPDVEIDNVALEREGQLGVTKRRYRVVYEDGEEITRYLEDMWAAQPPITKTMAYGTKIVIRTLDTPDGPIEYWRKMRVYVTSYMPASCGKSKDDPHYGFTRVGWQLRRGIVAVDPKVIPLLSYLYVPGYGPARAGDTGGGVKGKFVDLGFTDDDYESWHWWMDVYLQTPVPPAHKILWVLPDYPRFPDRKRH